MEIKYKEKEAEPSMSSKEPQYSRVQGSQAGDAGGES